MNTEPRNYHHGDLYNALIVAAAQLIEENDSLSFSITDAAKRAGVSSAAPYRHFKDKDALLDAVRDLAFLGLNEVMLTAADREIPGCIEQITALGCAYIEYARTKRAFFSLMWQASGDMASRQEAARMKASGFRVLVGALERHIHQRGIRDYPVLRLATQMWSMVHGIATLECNHMLDTFDREVSPRQLVIEGTRALLNTLPGAGHPAQAGFQQALPID